MSCWKLKNEKLKLYSSIWYNKEYETPTNGSTVQVRSMQPVVRINDINPLFIRSLIITTRSHHLFVGHETFMRQPLLHSHCVYFYFIILTLLSLIGVCFTEQYYSTFWEMQVLFYFLLRHRCKHALIKLYDNPIMGVVNWALLKDFAFVDQCVEHLKIGDRVFTHRSGVSHKMFLLLILLIDVSALKIGRIQLMHF